DTLKQVGINAELRAMDTQTLMAGRAKKDPVAEGGWSLFVVRGVAVDYLDPFSVLLTGSGEKGYPGWLTSPELEKLKLDFAGASDPQRRKEIADEIQRVAYDQVAYVPLGTMR